MESKGCRNSDGKMWNNGKKKSQKRRARLEEE
jgi:hypothetical protein